jgi:hypothetical protein
MGRSILWLVLLIVISKLFWHLNMCLV